MKVLGAWFEWRVIPALPVYGCGLGMLKGLGFRVLGV